MVDGFESHRSNAAPISPRVFDRSLYRAPLHRLSIRVAASQWISPFEIPQNRGSGNREICSAEP